MIKQNHESKLQSMIHISTVLFKLIHWNTVDIISYLLTNLQLHIKFPCFEQSVNKWIANNFIIN